MTTPPFAPLHLGTFRTIVVDCPWPFPRFVRSAPELYRGNPLSRVTVDRQYSTMTVAELCGLPVAELAHPDGAVLLAWATNRHLATGEAAQLVAAWGADAKTVITWRKPRPGPGRWARGRTEHVILATFGRPALPDSPEETIFDGLAGEGFSAKPASFYDACERLFPGPRVDVFARQTRMGWASWGLGHEQERSA